jgi:hypothetical protein
LFELALLKVTTAPLGALTTLQTPLPTVTALAFNVWVEVQTAPATVVITEGVGNSSRTMVTSLVDAAQVPLEIVHLNT